MRVDRDRAVRVVEQHRRADVLPAGAQVHPGGVDQPRVEAEPDGGVVVAAGDDHLRAARRASRASASSASSTASTGGSARS